MTALQFLLQTAGGSTKDITSSLKSLIFALIMIIALIGVLIWWLKR